jgi:hypothetical protein
MFEVNITNGGVSGRFGTGGIDVGGALYSLAKRGIDYAELQEYIRRDEKRGTAAYEAYAYGDILAETTAMRLESGLDRLVFETRYDESGRLIAAQTTRDEEGRGRLITMADLGNAHNNGIVLQHEAYRDGYVGSNQSGETWNAVVAHTEMAERMKADGVDFNMGGSLGLEMMLYEYAQATGDWSMLRDYADKAYDSSADFWRLRTVTNANGNVIGYSVDWDDDLNLTIENADGSVTRLDYNNIQTETGLNTISQWFFNNGLAFGDNLRTGFTALGAASEATQVLIDTINANDTTATRDRAATDRTLPDQFRLIANNFRDSIGTLINSGLQIGGLGSLPDQTAMYSLMPDSPYRTTLYGLRLVTPELNGNIDGTLYDWGLTPHDAEDYTGGSVVQTPTTTNSVGLSWSNSKGFGIAIDFGNGYSLTNNHLGSVSGMDLLKAMLSSGSTRNIAAGLQFATIGNTGWASTGAHNHLEGSGAGVLMAPSAIFTAMGIPANYTNSNTQLTGYPRGTAYNNRGLLQDILNYDKRFDRQAYVNRHVELFQPYSIPVYGGLSIDYVFDTTTMSYRRRY